MRWIGHARAMGWWGIAFVVLLLASAAMVSVPTAAESGARNLSFDTAHGQVILLQQIPGTLALVPFTAFALSLSPNRWLLPSVLLFVPSRCLPWRRHLAGRCGFAPSPSMWPH